LPLGIGVALAIPGGSGGHPSPENAFRGFSNVIWKAIFVSRRSRRRGGLRTPARECRGFTYTSCPLGCPAIVHAAGGNAMPCHSSRWITRAHRVRPSEKKASRVVSGYSPLSYRFALALPRRGGLRTPARKALASPRHVSARPPGVRLRMGCEWNASAFVRPSHAGAETAPLRENRLGRHLLAFPVRPSHLGWPSRGGAGSARPQKPTRLRTGTSPLGHRVFAYASTGNAMPPHVCGLAPRPRVCIPSIPPGFQYDSLPPISAGPLGGLPPLKGRKLQRGVSSWEKEPREDAF
jgi:hypothetical protein